MMARLIAVPDAMDDAQAQAVLGPSIGIGPWARRDGLCAGQGPSRPDLLRRPLGERLVLGLRVAPIGSIHLR